MLKIIAFYIITLKTRLYVRLVILLTDGRQLLDKIISLRGEAWVHKTSLTPPLCIEVPVPSQESEQSCICGYRLCLCFYGFLLDFRIVPIVLYFCFVFHLITIMIYYFSITEQCMLNFP
jgi:hypothetical protein